MLWIALSRASPSTPEANLRGWAQGFSPRVAVQDEALLLEAQASERLFGGRRALLLRLHREAAEQGVPALACAPTALAALALLRQALDTGAATTGCGARGLQRALDALPVAHLSAAREHASTLHLLGCQRLGQLRALPRNGLARRFGAALLDALDRAYGYKPDSLPWLQDPERFERAFDCPAAVESGPGLLFGVSRLLEALGTWLRARQRGATTLTLHWRHDTPRHSERPDGALSVRSAAPTADTRHWQHLLAEHLNRTTLAAPVRSLRLLAEQTEPLASTSASLLPDGRESGEPLHHFIERVSARLGPQRVWRPQLQADHRPQHMTRWEPATAAPAPPQPRLPARLAQQPAWLLEPPRRLAMAGERPLHLGPLQLLAGPERLESGWWPGTDGDPDTSLRDYYVAESPHAGLLWVYRLRTAGEPAWFLHGIYG